MPLSFAFYVSWWQLIHSYSVHAVCLLLFIRIIIPLQDNTVLTLNSLIEKYLKTHSIAQGPKSTMLSLVGLDSAIY